MFKKRDKEIILLLLSVLLPALLLFFMPENLQPVYRNNWICDSVCLGVCSAVLFFMYHFSVIDLLSPVTFVATIYLVMFYVTPLYDIAIGETSVFGVTDLFQYGVKSTIIATLGFLSFGFVYALRHKRLNNKLSNRPKYVLDEAMKAKIAQLALIAWILDFVIAITLISITNGFSITYILSFGLLGSGGSYETVDTSLSFIIQFTRSIVSFYLIYACMSKNRTVKIVLFIFTAMLEVINGFRYMIVILVFAAIYNYFIQKDKRIKLVQIIALVVVLATIVGIVGFTRRSVRAGNGFNLTGFTLNSIISAVLDNFRIYKSYYAVVKAVPNMTPYIYGAQIFVYTLVMAVPRVIWPGKPTNPGTEAQLLGMNQAAVSSGFAYPCLGEYYYGFGILGVIVFMGIIGAWLARISARYRDNAENELDIARYAVLTPVMLQLLIRGYTPSNFYLVVAMAIPFIWLTAVAKRKIK